MPRAGPPPRPPPPGPLSRRILRQAHTAELPSFVGREEVAIGASRMAGGRCRGAAAQHHLPDHELAIVLADRARPGAEPRIGPISAAGPLPGDSCRFGEIR